MIDINRVIEDLGFGDRVSDVFHHQLSERDVWLLDAFLSYRAADIPIYHYLRLDYFKILVTTGKVRFRRVNNQPTDPYDGTLPQAHLGPAVGVNQFLGGRFPVVRDAAANWKSHEAGKNHTFIHCWYSRLPMYWKLWMALGLLRPPNVLLPEKRRMWEDFGDGGFGICVQSTTRAFFNSLKVGDDFNLDCAPCPYPEPDEQLFEGIPVLGYLANRPGFNDENEVRYVLQRDCGGSDLYVDVPCDVENFLGEVLVGPLVPDDECEAIVRLVKTVSPHTPVRPSLFRGAWFNERLKLR